MTQVREFARQMTTRELVSVIKMGRAMTTPSPVSETELMERFEAGDPEAVKAVETLTQEDN